MAGKVKTADQLKQALILRNGGYSLAAIAVKTGISTTTLSRHFSKHSMAKGGLTDEAVTLAKQELMNDAGFVGEIKQLIASVVADDLAIFIRLREAIAANLEEVLNDKSLASHYKSRAIAALSTSAGLSQTLARKALQIDNQPIEQDELPELTILELTSEDIEHMRTEQRLLDHATEIANYEDDDLNDVIEEI